MTLISSADETMEDRRTGERIAAMEDTTQAAVQVKRDFDVDVIGGLQSSSVVEKRNPANVGGIETDGVPVLMVQAATPVPHPQAPDINNNNNNNNNINEDSKLLKPSPDDIVKEEDEDDAEEMSDDGGEEEEVEEEEEEPEMTVEQKKDMHECVKSGDIDSLEDCLDLPGADINMTWFRENLLMTAIRYDQREMAEFLLDNGVDHTFTTSILGMRETSKGKLLERYQLTCRQMAYDKEMFDIVDLIDSLQGQLFPFIRLPERTPRFRRPRPPSPTESESGSDESSEGADVSSEGEKGEEESKEGERQPHRKKKRKKKMKERDERTDGKASEPGDCDGAEEDGDGERDKTIGTCSGADVDSGHHSLSSSKLKMALLREHDRLMEKEEKEEEERERKQGSLEDSSSQRRKSHKAKSSASSEARDKVGSVKSRAQTEALREEQGSDQGEQGGTRDEGYGGSASLHSGVPRQSPQQILSPDPGRPWDTAPTNRIRATKSALTVRRSLHTRYGRRVLSGNSLPHHLSESGYSTPYPLNFEDAGRKDISNEPLHWRKVSTTGSYARESRNWHQAQPTHNQETSSLPESVEISEISLGFPASHRTSIASSSSLKSSTTATQNSAMLPKSIIKSNTLATTNTTSSGSERMSSSAAGTASPSEMSSSSCGTGRSGKTRVAGYLRATRSTAIKCRLTPRFTSNYRALDFQAKARNSTKDTTGSTLRASTNSNHGSENVSLVLAKLSSQTLSSDGPMAPRTASKKHTIPVVTSTVGEHQKRNNRAISYRS